MTKTELITNVARRLDITKSLARDAVESVFDEIVCDLNANGKTALPGIGTLTVKAKAATTRRNPKTGAPVDVAEGKRIAFKAGRELKREIAA